MPKQLHHPQTKLVSLNFNGNLHEIAAYVNNRDLTDFFIQAHCDSAGSIVLFRVPAEYPTDRYGPLSASTEVYNQP